MGRGLSPMQGGRQRGGGHETDGDDETSQGGRSGSLARPCRASSFEGAESVGSRLHGGCDHRLRHGQPAVGAKALAAVGRKAADVVVDAGGGSGRPTTSSCRAWGRSRTRWPRCGPSTWTGRSSSTSAGASRCWASAWGCRCCSTSARGRRAPRGWASWPAGASGWTWTRTLGLKVPHMGWNQLARRGEQPLAGRRGRRRRGVLRPRLPTTSCPTDGSVIATTTDYGRPFVSSLSAGAEPDRDAVPPGEEPGRGAGRIRGRLANFAGRL